MRGLRGGNDEDPLEAQLIARRSREAKMTEMERIEGPAKEPEGSRPDGRSLARPRTRQISQGCASHSSSMDPNLTRSPGPTPRRRSSSSIP